MRRRVWIPCYHWPDIASLPDEAAGLTEMSNNLLKSLTESKPMQRSLLPTTLCHSMSQILMDECDDEFQHWLGEAIRHKHRVSEDDTLKWRRLHHEAFSAAGLEWPPVYCAEFQNMVAEFGIGVREAEYIHYEERVKPVILIASEDEVLDVSQGLGRGLHTADTIPTITPVARLWLRRRKRWLVAPEAIRAQGYDLPPGARRFSHRQILDLIGNSFHGDSLIAALCVALASAPSLQSIGREEPSMFSSLPSSSQG